ncbi:MAG: cytochrome c [Verrucomicrobia bacterium]|nr:cytochrome c [Verrucomicrobiota bacterium]
MKHRSLLLLGALSLALSAESARALDLKEYWVKNCAQCHGPDGKGQTKMGKKLNVVDLTDAKIQEKYTDEQMFTTIKEGVKDNEGKVRMKPAAGVTDGEVKTLVAYVRTLKGQ